MVLQSKNMNVWETFTSLCFQKISNLACTLGLMCQARCEYLMKENSFKELLQCFYKAENPNGRQKRFLMTYPFW